MGVGCFFSHSFPGTSTEEHGLQEKIRNHEQDGNELQTTPEFRAHVPEAAPRKRSALQHSSSSGLESDSEWQRCQEVAVTAADILKQSGLPPPAAQDSGQTIEAVWKKVKKKKKKKKKKGKREENGQPESGLALLASHQSGHPNCCFPRRTSAALEAVGHAGGHG
uniref:Protein CUSTOS n=1 Tax=Naja naja TaxID=35670 RepID=A0A8C6YC83_NAJNA